MGLLLGRPSWHAAAKAKVTDRVGFTDESLSKFGIESSVFYETLTRKHVTASSRIVEAGWSTR